MKVIKSMSFTFVVSYHYIVAVYIAHQSNSTMYCLGKLRLNQSQPFWTLS